MEEGILTFTGRLATFEQSHHLPKRRASSTKKKTSSTASWPHRTPTAEELASAGFYYKPTGSNPDNVCCFLCKTQLDGWEPGDDPALEHLTHSPDCGWAINHSIRLRNGNADRNEEDPLCDKMIAARRATFMDKWPYEDKKGWRCKIQKMVDAGWVYDPAPDADDGATCCYCNLSLDGWEPKDNPMEEHRKRSEDCYFFIISDHFSQSRKATRKKARGSAVSRASRLSTQSNLTSFSEAPSLVSLGDDALAGADDSILSTATTATVMTTASTGGKTRKGKSRTTSKGTKKSTRGRKNTVTDEELITDEIMVDSDKAALDEGIPPAPKARSKRQTAQREEVSQIDGSSALDNAAPSKKSTRGRKTRTKAKAAPDEDESQLQSELLDAIEKAKAKESTPPRRGTKRTSEGIPKNEPSITILADQPVPAKEKPRGRPKKPSKRAEPESQAQALEELAEDFVVEVKPSRKTRKGQKPQESQEKDTSHMNSPIQVRSDQSSPLALEPTLDDFPIPPVPKQAQNDDPGPEKVDAESLPALHQHATPVQTQGFRKAGKESTPSPSPQSSDAENKPPSSRPTLMRPPLSAPRSARVPLGEATPMASPSKRPNNRLGGGLQSSIPWDPVDLETVFLPSPTTRRTQNRLFDIGTGLQGFDKENFASDLPLQEVVRRVKDGLTSPEKKMSVEEWISFNAKRGEEMLRNECERMVGAFEAEGGRAIRVLEGIECEE